MSTPARLHKQQEKEVDIMMKTIQQRAENIILRYGHILIPLLVVLALIGFIALCFVICGASATDSGVQYNAMEKII